jgi:hypothetical protein
MLSSKHSSRQVLATVLITAVLGLTAASAAVPAATAALTSKAADTPWG